MAISSEDQTKLLKGVIGLFDAAAGMEINAQLENAVDNGLSIPEVLNILTTKTEFTEGVMGSATTSAEQAAVLAGNFGLTADDVEGSPATLAINHFEAGIDGGTEIGTLVYQAVVFLMREDLPAEFAETAQLLENKAAVSAVYSQDHPSTDLETLTEVLKGVDGSSPWTEEQIATHIAALDGNGGDGSSFTLTVDPDNIAGTSGNDVFVAHVFDNQNTLQSGDVINGGAGDDALYAEVGNSQNFAISAKSTGVETVLFDARSDSFDSNDNNLQNAFVQIDARDMRDVLEWGSNGSRADVVIEDIEINPGQITEDITFSMRDTDPGSNADGADGIVANDTQAGASLHAYFEPNSLIPSGALPQGSQLEIRLVDPLNFEEQNAPLEFLPVNGVSFDFVVGGVTERIFVSDEEAQGPIETATDYTELANALQARLDELAVDNQALSSIVVENTGVNFTETGTQSTTGSLFTGTGQIITLTTTGESTIENGGFTFADDTSGSFIQIGSVTGDVAPTTTPYITANIILDNVGRGSEGGDAEIGGMSTRGGVEKFEVVVEDNSWVTGMRSTNDTLEVVDIVNADNHAGYLYLGSGIEQTNDLIDFRPWPEHLQTNGLVDVRTVNGTEFIGDLRIGASLTEDVHDRYLKPEETDVEGSEADDDFLFNYSLGTGDDYLNMHIRQELTADSDFSFIAAGGSGNDNIRTQLYDIGAAGNRIEGLIDDWYLSQRDLANITINGGEGSDIIETLGIGDAIINGGAGDDAIYADNTGKYSVTNPGDTLTTNIAGGLHVINTQMDNELSLDKAIWTATNFETAAENYVIRDLSTATVDTIAGIKGQVWVSFRDIPSEVVSIAYNNVSNTTSSLQIRQAIKDAVNNDPELQKLLIVKDGPGDTFIIESLIDGVMDANDLGIHFSTQQLTQQEVDNNLGFDEAAATTAYGVVMAQSDQGGDLVGAVSTSPSDNTIDAGTGAHDVIVLGTTDNGSDALNSSNDGVVFNGNFEHVTILNFVSNSVVNAFGDDWLDFSSYMNGEAPDSYVIGGDTLTDNDIILGSGSTTYTTAADSAAKGVILEPHATDPHVMDVYAAASTASDTEVTVEKVGTIDLADVEVGDLVLADFFDTSGGGGSLPPDGGGNGGGNGVTDVDITTDSDLTAVDGTAERFVFAEDTLGDSTITDFTVTEDSIQFDLDPAANFTTLDELNGFALADGDVVAVQQNQITGSTFVNLGIDEGTGNAITLELIGVADPSTVAIEVI